MSLALLVSEGASGASLIAEIFSPKLGLVVWTWIIFIALFFALKKLAWPSILQLTEERERSITNALAEAEKLNAEAKANAAEQAKLLAEARTQAAGFVATARAQAEKETAAAIERAKAEQEELVARARREIVAERERAVQELRAEAVELSLAAASKLVGQRLDSEADKQIVTSYLATLGSK